MKKEMFSDLESHYKHDIKTRLELQEPFFFKKKKSYCW